MTLHRWRAEHGVVDRDAAERLKDLERGNAWLKRLVADQQLDIQFLQEVVERDFLSLPRRHLEIEYTKMVAAVSDRRACRIVGQQLSTQLRTAPPNPYQYKLGARMREPAMTD